QIQRIKECEIVGGCDREELMAKQLAERFGLKHYFSDLANLFNEVRPEVIHITTPPQSHFELTRQCLQQGCHVYVEKPFTLNTKEAEELIELAEARNLKLTVGHDLQYSHVMRRLRQLIRDGYLGGAPVHMESHYCYDLGNTAYAKALLADKKHWVRRLPGKLLHNIISHGISRIAEFLASESPEIVARAFASPLLKSLGEKEICDELRVIVTEDKGATAYFTFSSQMRPSLNQFRIYGPRNGLMLDQENETLIRLKGGRYKSYAEHFISPLVLAKQYCGNAFRNVRSFLANDFHSKTGMKYLIESFYRSITEGAPVPIPYREILLTSRIMDEVFEQIAGKDLTDHGQSGDSGG
ncbi:MAG TPA: Gfo/Idh/MocA family oxidoreductase, partial [Nitrososphaera sp.]|nr:Gfo/Idh/MocA family oxidoreductase [Nitrososphaera sp.]